MGIFELVKQLEKENFHSFKLNTKYIQCNLLLSTALTIWQFIQKHSSSNNNHIIILAIIGSTLICFSFKVQLILNKIDTFFNRNHSLNDYENETSNFAI